MCDDFNDELPEILVLGPGGVKGFVELGALFYLEKIEILKKINTYVGVSVGSVISLLLVCGYKVKEVCAEAADTDLFQDISSININDIKNNIGLMSNAPMKNKLSRLVSKKIGFVPTLHQLYLATGLKLVTVTLNLDSDEGVEYISYENESDFSCVDAVMLSMNIPLLFYKLRYKGNIYIDGAMGNPYPIDKYDDGKTKILGLYIETSRPEEGANSDSNNGIYLNRIIESTMRQLRKRIIKSSSTNCKHLGLDTSILDTTGFTVTAENKATMIYDGYHVAKKFVEEKYKNFSEK